MRERRNRAWLAAGLWLVPLLAGCRTLGLHHSQGGITIASGEVEIDCDVHNGMVAISFSGMTITSSRGPITRTVFQLGVDLNGNGKLDTGEVLKGIDNPHAGQSTSIASYQGTMGAGSTLIAHIEVFTGGTTPTFSKTTKHN